jgi:hypothetical protein
MATFALLWALNSVLLAASLGLLRFAYSRLGGEFGLKGWRSELGTLLVASLLFTLIGNGVHVFGDAGAMARAGAALYALGLVVLMLVYRLTHILEMEKLDAGIVPVVFAGLHLVTWFALAGALALGR